MKRALFWLLLDVQALFALAYPESCFYLPWLLRALYIVVACAVVKTVLDHRWILWIVNDREARVLHGLEHATISVLEERGVPVVHGYTQRRVGFVVALEGEQPREVSSVIRAAAETAIARVRAGDRSLMYAPDCNTTAVVAAVTFWAMLVVGGACGLALGASAAAAFAVTVTLGHIRAATRRPLGLLAQRLFTVGAPFTSACVIDIRPFERRGEPQFEVRVAVQVATHGGPVIPGIG